MGVRFLESYVRNVKLDGSGECFILENETIWFSQIQMASIFNKSISTINEHIKAIEDKDYVSFESTITDNKKLPFILPDGRYFEHTQEYRKILKEWFEEGG